MRARARCGSGPVLRGVVAAALLLPATAVAETRVAPLDVGSVPLSLGLLVVGTDPDTGTRPETAREAMSVGAEAIHFAAGVTGLDRDGTVTITVTQLADGQDVLHRRFGPEDHGGPGPVVVTAVLPRPPDGWSPGLYGVSVADGDTILGGRLFTLEDTP